jgi:hypothetical protein
MGVTAPEIRREERSVTCQASAFLSEDGTTPFASNSQVVIYEVGPDLSAPGEVVLSGNLAENRRVFRLLLENVGVLEVGRMP